MIELKGIKEDPSRLNLIKQGDLLYHEGPVLSHFLNDRGEHCLMLWVDRDAQVNRWLVFEVTPADLLAYYMKKLSLLELVEKNWYVRLVDIDHSIRYRQVMLVDDIPQKYRPGEKSYYDPDQFEAYAQALENRLKAKSIEKKKKTPSDEIGKSLLLLAQESFGKESDIAAEMRRLALADYVRFVDEMSRLTVPVLINMSAEYSRTHDEHIRHSFKLLVRELAEVSLHARSFSEIIYGLHAYTHTDRLVIAYNIGKIEEDIYRNWIRLVHSEKDTLDKFLNDLKNPPNAK
jgi:hypothetical protein